MSFLDKLFCAECLLAAVLAGIAAYFAMELEFYDAALVAIISLGAKLVAEFAMTAFTNTQYIPKSSTVTPIPSADAD